MSNRWLMLADVKICPTGKTIYPSEAEAKIGLRALRKKQPDYPGRSYRCLDCDGYHFGRPSKTARLVARTGPGVTKFTDRLESTPEDMIADLRRQLADYEHTFDLQHRRMKKAIDMWRAAHPGNDLVQPDLGRLLDWLMEGAPFRVKRDSAADTLDSTIGET